jgi:circadian clock protein KaiB
LNCGHLGSKAGWKVVSVATYVLELYIAGDTLRSQLAIQALHKICERLLQGHYQLSTIDVLMNPERAELAKVLATPTLLKLEPAPIVRIIGDLTLTAKVIAGLGIHDNVGRAKEETRNV